MTIRVIGVLAYDRDRVLLVRHTGASPHSVGKYGIPGGRLQEGESEKAACIRKLCSETGFMITENDLVEMPKIYSANILIKNRIENFSMKSYVCNSWQGNLVADEPEVIPEWVSMYDMSHYTLLPNVGEIINDGLVFRR